MRRLLVSGAIFFFVACSGRAPTTPETAGSEGARASGAAASTQPQRPGTRVVAPRPSAANRVAFGVWGGDHVNLVVTDTGGALEYDCAHGTIDQPFVVDSSGRFDLAGTHTREHGGPIRSDEKPDKHPARYTGTTDGQTMPLTVTLTDSTVPVGTFTLTRGQIGRIVKCL
ncbi:MAG TPA: hypothetical protein VGS98_11035 [Thermoanaerobaculia bacterium]|jgi:hypothetical protein|nr:hypothetical protein [Thermoanaerobaculia bacterium]